MQNLSAEAPLIACTHLSKSYQDGKTCLTVLSDLSCAVHVKDRVAIVGPSGSGKSTLLHLMGGLDGPTSGEVMCQGVSWRTMSEKQRCHWRNRMFGFVYQFHHLLPEFTAIENVAMPLLLSHISCKQAMEKARALLVKVGLEHRLTHKPSQLSGGERQRVAIARALVHEPACVLADEPTGNLDRATALSVLALFIELNQTLNTALVIVTHDSSLASQMDKVLTLEGGKLVTKG